MTQGELLARTTSRELTEWRAFYRIEQEERAAAAASSPDR